MLSDVSVDCPYKDKMSAAFLWAVLATCMYPIGLPTFMYWTLNSFGIPALAKKRLDNAILSQLLQVYRHHNQRSLLNFIAQFVGVGLEGSIEEFRGTSRETVLRERAETMFQHASGGEVSLTYEMLINYLDEIGISGEHEEELQDLMLNFDDDGNGTLEIDEFCVSSVTFKSVVLVFTASNVPDQQIRGYCDAQEMIKDIVLHASQISGHESLETLDERQLELLCRVP